MANILTCTRITRRTTISNISTNVWDIYSILMFFLPHSRPQFTQSFQGNVVYIEIMNCTSSVAATCWTHIDIEFRYIKALHTYLISFTKRAQPLTDVELQQKEAEEIFTKQWEAGEIEGWEDRRQEQAKETGEGIWCAACKYVHCNNSSHNKSVYPPQARSCILNRRCMTLTLPQRNISKLPRSKSVLTNRPLTPTVLHRPQPRTDNLSSHRRTSIERLLFSPIWPQNY